MKRIFSSYKNAYIGLPKEIWTLAVLTLINRMGTMVLPFLSVYLTTSLNFSLHEAGILVSSFGVGALGGTYVGGRLTDRFGGKVVIFFSLLVGGGLFICLQFVSAFLWLYLLMATTAFFGEAYRPAMSAMIGEYSPPGKIGRSTAFLRLAINLGMSASPAVGGLVVVSLGYPMLFWIDGLTCIGGALFFIWRASSWVSQEVADTSKEEGKIPAKALAPYQSKKFLFFLLSTLVAGIVFVQGFHSLPVFLKSEWGYDEDLIGILMGLSSLLIVLFEMPIVHELEGKKKINFSIRVGLVLFMVCYLPFLLPAALPFGFLVIILYTFGEIFYLPFNNALPLEISPPAKRGEYMAWYWMTWSLCNIMGPGLGLGLADAFGFSVMWVAMAGLAGLSMLIHQLTNEE